MILQPMLRAICNKQEGKRILCSLRCVCKSCLSPRGFPRAQLTFQLPGPRSPFPWQHMLPLPSFQFLVTGLEILGPRCWNGILAQPELFINAEL